MANGKCSYCYHYKKIVDRTHNRASCKVRKYDKDLWIKENKEWAIQFKKNMKKIGYGIGAIISFENSDMPYVIQSVTFEHISKDSLRAYAVLPLDKIDDRDAWWYTLHVAYPTEDFPGIEKVEILSPVDPEIVGRQFPPDWETGTYGIPHNLKDTVRRTTKKS